MQDVQNIPNPDINSTETEDDFGNHSDFPDTDVEQPAEDMPVPPDVKQNVPIEEPPAGDGEDSSPMLV